MTRKTNPEKTVDVPPTGDRNPDPITDAPGSHPVETGIGAALGGAASGAAVGAVTGPVGAAVGAVVGAVAGGYAGKGVGEMIDPTTEDNWLRENFTSRPYVGKGERYEPYEPAYQYGGLAESKYQGKHFSEIEHDLRQDWERGEHAAALDWDRAKGAVQDAYDRTLQLRAERLKVTKRPVQTGDVTVRKEVVTEQKTITVPVEHEEVVIERRPVSGKAASGKIGDTDEIRVPVQREEVEVTKEPVVTDEVSIGKRKVQGSQEAAASLRKEQLKVEKHGEAQITDRKRKPNDLG